MEGAVAGAGTWISVLPPLLAIVLALTLRQVLPALFAGLWLGSWAINGFSLAGLWNGLLETFQVHILDALASHEHAAIVLFTFMIGGMVGIISRNGGMQGIVNGIVSFADSARHACLATATMGLAIFFDDYANTLVVGNTMRPVTDSMKVSRAKLAYIVDSTAAPVACVAVVTTWIGYEVGLISDALAGLPDMQGQAYLVYLATIPYSFYPLLAVVFVFMVTASGRDFGPMLVAEQRARSGASQPGRHLESAQADDAEPIRPVRGKPHRAVNAILPIVVMLAGVVGGLYVTGSAGVSVEDPGVKDILGEADSIKALLWGSLLGAVTAAALSMAQRILSLEQVVNAWYQGMRAMVYAMIILVLAWGLGNITMELKTADYLVSVLGDALPVQLLPALVFVIAAATAFATGASWGSMAILVPLVIPLSWAVMQASGSNSSNDMHLFYSSIASVLAGSVWGDHCSPISDTTILSSLASGCDHVEHVHTQMPYALLVGAVALLGCSLPVAFGLPWWLALAASAGLLYLVLRVIGRQTTPAGE